MKQEPIYKGIIVGLCILGSTLLIGGLYLWGGIMAREGAPEMEDQPRETEHRGGVPQTQSTSTEIFDIEADLNAVNLDGIEEDLRAIEKSI